MYIAVRGSLTSKYSPGQGHGVSVVVRRLLLIIGLRSSFIVTSYN